MKPESLVIPGQPNRGEYVLESCTRVAMRSEHLVGASGIEKSNRAVAARSEIAVLRGATLRMKGESSDR
jgi:hypothetical protein